MKKQDLSKKLEQQWEQGIEQAQQESARQEPVSNEVLDSVAGLSVKSGILAGLAWSDGCSGGGCTGVMCH